MTVQQPPEEPRTAVFDRILAAALGAFPIVGDIAGATYLHMMEGRYNRRLAGWRHDVANAINDLAGRVDDLEDNEVFLDAFIASTRIAISTHQQEKREALRNALINSVALDAPDADEQAWFFRLVDEFTAGHLVLLERFDQYPASDERVDDRQLPTASGIWGYSLDEVVAPRVCSPTRYPGPLHRRPGAAPPC